MVRWDNSIRFNALTRIQERDQRIALAAPRTASGTGFNFDGGDYLVDQYESISRRLDLLSELDVSYRGRFGARVSAAAWYDQAFPDHPSYAAINNAVSTGHGYANDQWSNYVKRYYQGPSGEILDAFAFSNLDIAETAWNVKVGRHAVIWGEGLIGSTHSVAYSQAPSDGMKSVTNPGASAKETALPVGQVSVIGQIDPTLTLLGQYQFEWRSSRFPEGSTYFGGSNLSVIQGATLNRGLPHEGDSGNWGVGIKWSPAWLDGTLGVFYRRFDDFNPWAAQVIPETVGTVASGLFDDTRAVYLKNVSLWGVTLSKNIAGISWGAELSHRHNGALSSSTTDSAPGTNAGAIGDTWHGLLNGVASFSRGPADIWDTASLLSELAWSRLDTITKNDFLFRDAKPGHFAACRTTTASIRSCYRGDYLGFTVSFTPSWQQVLPGVDLSMPLLLSSGIRGNAPTNGGGSQGFVTYKLGLSATAYARHQFDLAYTGYRQNVDRVTLGTDGLPNGRVQGPPYSDKGFLSFTYQTTF